MKRIISYSLWGDSKFYCQGAIDNVGLARIYYPDWVCRFYVAKDCPAIDDLRKLPSETCEVVECPACTGIDRSKADWVKCPEHASMFWRFEAMSDPDVERVIFRDTDSRLGPRERWAVDEWIRSGLITHRMHEVHAHLNGVFMGGMWGIRGGVIRNVGDAIRSFISIYPRYNEPWIFCDLIFLRDVLWPHVKDSCLGHGYGHPNAFAVDNPDGTFVGQCINEEWRHEKYSGQSIQQE
jgi:hypothetical protein